MTCIIGANNKERAQKMLEMRSKIDSKNRIPKSVWKNHMLTYSKQFWQVVQTIGTPIRKDVKLAPVAVRYLFFLL